MIDRLKQILERDLEIAEKATPGPLMGRSEPVGFNDLMWCVYQGKAGVDGFQGKEPIAMFTSYDDARFLIFAARTALPRNTRALIRAIEALEKSINLTMLPHQITHDELIGACNEAIMLAQKALHEVAAILEEKE